MTSASIWWEKIPVAAMYRYNDADFRANITNGGSMKPYEPKEAQVELARKVMRTLGLDFGSRHFVWRRGRADPL